MERLFAKSKERVVGDPLQPSATVGAMTSREHYDRVMDSEVKEGGKFLAGGGRLKGMPRASSSSPRSSRGWEMIARL